MGDGSLVYTDGSAATRADIACNEGACAGTPCSPKTCGTTHQPPKPSGAPGAGAPQGGGSGGGSSGGSGSKAACNKGNSQLTALQNAVKGLGSTVASLMTGGKKVAVGTTPGVIAGAPVTANTCVMSSNAFLLVVLVVGGLLLMMAFGRGRAA